MPRLCLNAEPRVTMPRMVRREKKLVKLTLLFYVCLVFMNVLACKVNRLIDDRNSRQ